MTKFRDVDTIRERFNNHPKQFIGLLETAMTEEQITALEASLFPEPDDAARRVALESARLVLIRAGLPADDSVIRTLDAEIAALPAEVRQV